MKHLKTIHICVLAFAAALNVIGGSLALYLRLPIYLDSAGTMLVSALLGPFYGMIPGILSGIISGCLNDIYALYYIPVQVVCGFTAGMVFKKVRGIDIGKGLGLLLASLIVSAPGTIVSALITACVFGGITSSGSSILAQFFHSQGMGLTQSIVIVQFITDYGDRAAVLAAVAVILHALPCSLKRNIKKGARTDGAL